MNVGDQCVEVVLIAHEVDPAGMRTVENSASILAERLQSRLGSYFNGVDLYRKCKLKNEVLHA